ncbi:hypothetical protein [Peribacillus kribbensis]|uniref:hypothetical protein n=1 Tax=Peribacillus kribbensis TaxID=356658 RepID=UPI000414267C|nr:hypothetical protein [Peribacillus kribbensis]
MNRFTKLLNFELKRFSKIYAVLLGLTILVQFLGTYLISRSYMSDARKEMRLNVLSQAEYIMKFGLVDFSNKVMNSLWFAAPIAICAAALILYIFLIWYRDWSGKNTFIYRLLMLPASRSSIYFSKALAIFLMVLGLVGVQLLIFPLEVGLFKALVPGAFRRDFPVLTLLQNNTITSVFLPKTFAAFLLYYSLGLLALFSLFTAVLLERSYRIKGIVLGILYCAAVLIILFAPIFILETLGLGDYLYPEELLSLVLIIGLILLGCTIWLGCRLITKKVSV